MTDAAHTSIQANAQVHVFAAVPVRERVEQALAPIGLSVIEGSPEDMSSSAMDLIGVAIFDADAWDGAPGSRTVQRLEQPAVDQVGHDCALVLMATSNAEIDSLWRTACAMRAPVQVSVLGPDASPESIRCAIEIAWRSRRARTADHSRGLEGNEEERQGAIDALQSHIAVLDPEGRIISTNKAWRDFARSNDYPTADYGLGANYVQTCRDMTGCAPDVNAIADAIEDVLGGRRQSFTFEYPCHAPDEKRWFVMRVTRCSGGGPACAVVAHDDITVRRIAEDQLRESEERFRTMADAAPMEIWIADRDRHLIYFNLRWLDFRGRTAEQELGWGWTEGIHPDDYESCINSYIEAFDRRDAFQLEFRMMRGDGSYRWLLNQGVPHVSPDGVFQGYIGSAVDITDRKLAEERLSRSEEQLRLITDALPAFIAYVDRDYRYRFVNAAYESWFGMKPEDLRGRTIAEALGMEIFTRVKSRLDLALAGERVSYDLILTDKHGDDHTFNAMYVPQMASDGTVSGVVTMISDVTPIKQAEAAVRESEARFRATFENAAVGIVEMSFDGRLLTVNEKLAEMLGYSIEQLLQMNLSHLVWPEDADGGDVRHRRLVHGEVESYSVEQRLLRRDGKPLWVNLSCSAVRRGGGADGYLVAVIEDIATRKYTENALRESRERLDTALAASQTGTFRWLVRSGALHLDRNMARMFGLADEDALQTLDELLALVHPDDRPMVTEAFEGCTDEDADLDLEFRVISSDRKVRWMYAKGSTFRNRRTAPNYMTGACIDITDRKTAEAELKRNRERLDLVLNSIDLGMFLSDHPMGDLEWNDTCRQHFDVAPDREPTVDDFYGLLHPDDRIPTRDAIERAIHEGTLCDIEFRVNTSNQRSRWLRFIARAFYDELDRPVRFDGVTLDITQKKSAEAALRHSEQQFRQLADSMPQMVWTAGPAGQLDYVNRRWREFFGIEPSPASTVWQGAMHPQDRQRASDAWEVAIRSGQPFQAEYRLLNRRTGEYRWHLGRAVPVRDDFAQLARWFGTSTDIDDQKRAEEALTRHQERLEELVAARTRELEASHQQLRMSERMAALGTLSAGLGHDMGNLLLPVRFRLDSLEAKPLPAELREDIAAIRQCTDYMQRLASGLRLLSIDPDEASATGDAVPLEEWWRSISPFLRNVLPRDVALHHALDGDLPALPIAKHRLTQAVLNLVQNAGEAIRDSSTGSFVRVWARRASNGAAVEVGVTDDGPGMDAETRRRCLEPFFSTKTRGLSTGLGLALVNSVMKKSGGSVAIESAPRKGTTFILSIPLQTADDQSGAASGGEQHVTAIIDIQDHRLRGYVASMLRMMRVQAEFGSHTTLSGRDDADGGPELLVVDHLDEEMLQQTYTNGRRVLVFADRPDDAPEHEGVHYLGAAAKPSNIRQVIKEVTAELRRTHAP